MTPTYGERLVGDLLKTLPKDSYYYFVEPHIASATSAYRDPDFVIVSPRLGVIVLEVKDWKYIKSLTQKEFIVEREDGESITEKSPVLIAKEYALNLRKRFETEDDLCQMYEGKRKLKFPIMHSVVLPHANEALVRQGETLGVWDPGQVIGQMALKAEYFETALTRLPWVWKLKTPLDQQTVDVMRGVLYPELVIKDETGKRIGVLTADQEKIERETLRLPAKSSKQQALPLELLSEETERLAETLSVRLIRGVAGSGKSLVLARRAQFLAEQYPDLNILVMAFNTDLVDDLKRRIPGAPNLEIASFHRICRRVIGKKWKDPSSLEGWLRNRVATVLDLHKLTPDYVAEEIEWRKEFDHYDNHAYLNVERTGRKQALNKEKRAAINQVFDQYQRHQVRQGMIDWSDVPFITLDAFEEDQTLAGHYDIILIDEAQDFAPSWIKVVKYLLKKDGNLFLCDDPTQSLFRAYSWREKGVEVVGRTRLLKVPFRCTREITLAAHSLIKGENTEENLEPDLTTYQLLSGDTPLLAQCRDADNEIQFVEEKALSALEDGMNGERIAILCHNKNYIRHWAYLRKKGCYVGSFKEMKGLEFQMVFVPYLHTAFDQVRQMSDESVMVETRKHIFTAMTRARETLIMSYQNTLPGELAALQAHTRHEKVSTFGRMK